MPIDEYEQYFNAINILESRQILNGFVVADWPHLKAGKRREVHSKFRKELNNQKYNANSTEDIARMLGAIDDR